MISPAPIDDAPLSPNSLASEFSYVDVMSNTNRASNVNSTPHRCAMVATPATLTPHPDIEAGNPTESEARESKNKIHTRDVANIFRASDTVEAVNLEQLRRIEEMRNKIIEAASFNFNYVCLLIIASFVAGLGLISNSSTMVVSSMLLSPIMGPVVLMAYGAIVYDGTLVQRAVKVELISLAFCVIIGMIVCVSTGWTTLATETWPTSEMTSRGSTTNLLVGIPVAFLSGLGVALSILDDQTSSLVGVAVSASLLPPAVNAGLCWIYAFVLQFEVGDAERREYLREQEFAYMGGISMTLTVSNILLVAISSALMFRIKEVLPVKKKIFWNDLKTARKINQKRAFMDFNTLLSFDNEEQKDE